MSVKVPHVVMLILMSSLTASLPLEVKRRYRRGADACIKCAAGKYQRSCYTCASCPANTFNSKENQEESCLDCFRDCRKELHLQVVSPCSKVADVVCECMEGFVCSKTDKYTNQCTRCKQQESHVQTTSQPPAQTFSHNVTRTVSYAPVQTTLHHPTSNNHTILSTVPQSFPRIHQTNITGILFLSFILFVIITFCVYKQRKIGCLKKRLKQCSVRKQKCPVLQENSKAISSEINKPNKQLHDQDPHSQTCNTSNTDCPTAQSASTEHPLPASGNLGPLHIYGAGTVFVSLLNQFGLNGGDKDEDLRQQPLNNQEMHSPSSPTIPLSKEEWNKDISFISFPSQEQGKECHMSKEEGL